MNFPDIHTSRTGLQFFIPGEPIISETNERSSLDEYRELAQINVSRGTKKQEKEEDEKKYRWLFLAITLPFIIMAGIAYLFRKKDDPGDGPDGGSAGGSGPANQPGKNTRPSDPPAVSFRSLLSGTQVFMPAPPLQMPLMAANPFVMAPAFPVIQAAVF